MSTRHEAAEGRRVDTLGCQVHDHSVNMSKSVAPDLAELLPRLVGEAHFVCHNPSKASLIFVFATVDGRPAVHPSPQGFGLSYCRRKITRQ